MKIMKQHLSTTVTDHFPQEAWRTLDIPNDSVHEPNVQNQYVFIRCIESVTIPDSTQMNNDDSEQTDNDTTTPGYNFSQGGQLQQAGMCLIVRYERIRHLLLEGKVELI
jgi:DNA replication complex GINS protein SLD5 C-terminus